MNYATKPPKWVRHGGNCYQTDFLFGLLPDGNAKLWLQGCGIFTYVGVFKPTKSVQDRYYKEAENIPIPWDKVDQVWYDKEYHRMQTLADVTKELTLTNAE